jgi:hypothetical protein
VFNTPVKFTNVVDYKIITRSMSRKGNCWDNAVAESFFKTLKTEQIYGNKLISKEQMERDIFEFIEIWYNRKRRHSALDYKTIRTKKKHFKMLLNHCGFDLYIQFDFGFSKLLPVSNPNSKSGFRVDST